MATVIHVEGSAYRHPGARMLITPEGQSWGMISGGCLEHDILQQARACLQTGRSRIVRYDSTSDDDVIFGTGLGCNGVIDILLEPVTDAFRAGFIETVERCDRTRQRAAIATVIEGIIPNHPECHAFLSPDGWKGYELPEYQEGAAKPAIHSFELSGGPARIFVQPLIPRVQLVLFGGWLDVLPVVRIAREVAFQVIVVDSRQRGTSLRFFREADTVLLCPPEEALSRITLDDRTVVVLMNHHFESDREALRELVGSDIPFIGMLGPKRRQQRILDDLRNEGEILTDDFVGRLHGPVGLDLGASGPEEIALSIMAEILAVVNQRSAKPIRERIAPKTEPAYA